MVVLGKSSKQVGGWFGSGCSPGPVAILYIVYLQHSSVSKVFGHPSNLSQLYTHDHIVHLWWASRISSGRQSQMALLHHELSIKRKPDI